MCVLVSENERDGTGAHECLKRTRVGETTAEVHSSGTGSGMCTIFGVGVRKDAIDSRPLVASSTTSPPMPASIMRSMSGRLTSASSKMRATREKYIDGRRSSRWR